MKHLHSALLATTALWCGASLMVLVPGIARANPQGGTVAAGQASIQEAGPKLDVHQSSDKAVIDWRSFDIAPGEHTQFHQPSANSFTLNRVGGASASQINGMLSANGNLAIVNQNGVVFGKNAKVDVGGLIATTANIDNQRFMDGSLRFDLPGKPNGVVVNTGEISAKDAGLVGLVAPRVENHGIIKAKLGKVHLASGERFTLDMAGDGLTEIAIDDASLDQLKQATGYGQHVVNTGTISVEGGEIYLTAAAARSKVDSLIVNAGIIEATSAAEKNGKIILYAEGSNAVLGNKAQDKGKKQGESSVTNSGILNASGRDAGERGGSIRMLGDNVLLLGGSIIDASGHTGKSGTTRSKNVSSYRDGSAGGDIRIGGDYLGGGDTPAAKTLYVSPLAFTLNDALEKGDAGRSIFWADHSTHAYGTVIARGGRLEGDGGFVETSGKHYLDFHGEVNLTARNGNKGTLLLDPANITIYGNVTPSTAGTTDLWFDGSDAASVTLAYNTTGTTATGSSGTTTLTTAADVSTLIPAGAKLRIGGTVYTVASVAGTTVTTVEALSANYAGDTLERGLISQWNDKSGNARHLTQADANLRPLWLTNAVNGRAAVQLDGTDDYLTVDDPALASARLTDYTLFGGFKTADADGGVIFSAINPTASGPGAADHDRQFGLENIAGNFVHRLFSDETITSAASYNNDTTHIAAARVAAGAGQYLYMNGVLEATGAKDTSDFNWATGYVVGGGAFWGYINGLVPELLLYNGSLSDNNRYIVDQYLSGKWNVTLTPPGTGGTEVARATASDGYSVFTTRYLERLSQSANIALVATNNITLDLQSDTLNFSTAGRSLTMTASNQITTASAGSITTNGGNIAFNATNGILFNHAIGLTSANGNINLNNNVTLGANQTWNAGTGTMTFGGTVNGNYNLTATAGTFSLASAWGGSAALNAVSLTSTNALTLPAISASSLLARTTGAGADITVNSTQTISGAGNALTLAAADDIHNNAGAGVFNLTGGGRWLLYSEDPAQDTKGGLSGYTKRYNKTYAGYPPASVVEAGNVWLYSLVPPTLTVTADNASRVYGAANPAFTASYSGFIDGDTAGSALSGSPSLTTTATGTSNVGAYTITAAAGTLASAMGYGFSYANGTLTINKAALTTTADDKSKTYGDANPALTATLTGFVNGETLGTSGVTGSASLSTAATSASNVGAYSITTALGTLAASNYDFSTFSNGTLTINKKALTAAMQNQSLTYGAATPTLSTTNASHVTWSGLVNGDTAGTLDSTTFSYGGASAGSVNNAGTYTLGISAFSDNNYSLTLPGGVTNGTLTINKAALTTTADDKSKTYGDANPALTATLTGFVNGETLDTSGVTGSASLSTAATSASNVGAYSITTALGTLAASNYDFSTFSNGTLTVNPASLTITADNKSRSYGAANPALTAGYSGFVNGDTSSVVSGLSLSTAADSGSNVGTYAITASGGTASNYSITHQNGTLTINKTALTVTADDKSREYGLANPTLTASYSGFVNGDTTAVLTGNPSLSTAAATISNVDTYSIAAALGTLAASNYDFTTFTNGTLMVAQAPLTITVNNASREEGTTNPTFAASFSGFRNSDTASVIAGLTFSTPAVSTSPPGNYTITPSGASALNYSLSYLTGTLTVTASPAAASSEPTVNESDSISETAIPNSSFIHVGVNDAFIEDIGTNIAMPTALLDMENAPADAENDVEAVDNDTGTYDHAVISNSAGVKFSANALPLIAIDKDLQEEYALPSGVIE